MNLSDFIEQRQSVLLETFIANVRKNALNPEQDTPRTVIQNAIPFFLLELVENLRQGRVSARHESTASDEHGEQRYDHGFDLDSVIREYGVLGQTILREAELAKLPVTVAEFNCLTAALNAGVANAVAAYVAVQNAEREELLAREHAARLEAEQLGQFKDEFLATLSHELRTPLQAILGYATAIATGHDRDTMDKGLAVIERNARSLTELIERLLDMSALKAGRVRLKVEDICLAEVVEATLATLERAAAARSITCAIVCNDARASFPGDKERVGQIVFQLLSNALRTSKPGGVVRADLVSNPDEIVLHVSDEGTSLEPDSVPHAFNMFVSHTTRARRTVDGLGIGLAFVKELVELHGGSVHATLNTSGVGTTFSASFPRRTVATSRSEGTRTGATRGAERESPSEIPGIDGRKVLVVDDEEDARELMALLLTRHGANVTTASTAQDALIALEREAYEFIISDIGLPGMDGLALIQRVRAHVDTKVATVRAIALTAFASTKDGERALSAGFDLFLTKPADAKSVLGAVKTLGDTRREA